MSFWRRSRQSAAGTFIGLLAAFALAGGAQAEPSGHRWVVGFAQDTMANDWRRAQTEALAAAFARHPEVRFVFTDAGGNTARQVLDIENMVSSGVDLLITSPRDAELMAPVIERVRSRGVPVVLLSRRTSSDAHNSFIRADNREIARQAARHLASRLGGKGRILMLQHIPSTSVAIERTEGFLDELGRYPGLRVVATKQADSMRDKAVQAVEQVLAEGLEFDAIYAQSDSMAAGARAALKRAGRAPGSIPIVGIDYIAEAQAAIRSGEQDASFRYPTFAEEGAAIAMQILRGQAVAQEVVVESVKVTRDNVDRIKPIF
jgi:ribose transport system substrate-binding protein